ncbi:MAG: DUF6000 family protein [Planctomycetota bacterium]
MERLSHTITAKMQTPFIKRWVQPFYLSILHGNYATRIVVGAEREQFNADVRTALSSMTPEIASELIRGYWREAITGSWFAGLKRYRECRESIGDRLLESKTCYAGQSHAFAMACFADDASVEYLTRYLNTYLRRTDCYYDQDWAMPALMWIDDVQETHHADEFLAPDGLWNHFTADKISEDNDGWTIERCRSSFWNTMHYCLEHFVD